MNTRQALARSVEITPNVLARTIETQRKQLRDHLTIADRARLQEDWEMWATAAAHVRDLTKALDENLEMQNSMTSLSDLKMFQAGTLIEHALKTFERDGDPTYAPALKKAHAALLKAEAAKKAGGARVRR